MFLIFIEVGDGNIELFFWLLGKDLLFFQGQDLFLFFYKMDEIYYFQMLYLSEVLNKYINGVLCNYRVIFFKYKLCIYVLVQIFLINVLLIVFIVEVFYGKSNIF